MVDIPTLKATSLVENGGRRVSIGDINLNVISSYVPKWERIYESGSYKSYDGREIKKCIGKKFSVDISTYGLTPSDIVTLRDELLNKDEIQLVCPEFSGKVSCDVFAPPVAVHRQNKCFYSASFTLTAVELEEVDGSL